MGKPANNADLQTQKATTVNMFTGEVEAARQSAIVLLNLLNNQSKYAKKGVTSFTVHDMEALGVEDTKDDGTDQNDLAGGAIPTTLVIDQAKTVPGYFYYLREEQSEIDWVKAFLEAAPTASLLKVEEAAMVALRAIGNVAGHYKQLSGTDSNGVANAVPTVGDYNTALAKLVREKKLKKVNLRSIGDSIMELELPAIFGLYNAEASGSMSEMAKMNGFVRGILGVPHFTVDVCKDKEFIVFDKTAVAWAIRTYAKLVTESQGSKNRNYYGVNISYGVVARQDNRAFIMQNGVAWAA